MSAWRGVILLSTGRLMLAGTRSVPSLVAGVSVGLLYLWSYDGLVKGTSNGLKGAVGTFYSSTFGSRRLLSSSRCERLALPIFGAQGDKGTDSCHIGSDLGSLGRVLRQDTVCHAPTHPMSRRMKTADAASVGWTVQGGHVCCLCLNTMFPGFRLNVL